MGTWKLTERRSEFSPGAPKNRTVVYEAQGDKVKIAVDSVSSEWQDDALHVGRQVRWHQLPGYWRPEF
jgi:hypothetical protein